MKKGREKYICRHAFVRVKRRASNIQAIMYNYAPTSASGGGESSDRNSPLRLNPGPFVELRTCTVSDDQNRK